MRLFFIINFGDRDHASRNLLERLREQLDASDHEGELHRSESIGHCAELIEDARARQFDCVVAGGGDGTLNTVLNMLKGDGPALGLLPLGTVNCFARSIGLRLDPEQAMRQLLAGSLEPINAGRINERWFLCFGGVGCDAASVHGVDTHSKFKHNFNTFAYMLSGAMVFFGLRGLTPFRLSGDVEADPAHSVILSQCINYAGFNLFRKATPQSDGLDALIMHRRSRIDLLRLATLWPLYARGWIAPPKSIEFRRVRQLLLEAQEDLIVQVDGEPITLPQSSRIELEWLAGAIRFLMPGGAG